MLEVSAPGKIHLIGEHSVVFGFPAILSAIEKRIKIKAEKGEKIGIKDNIHKKEGEFEIEEVLMIAKESEKLWQEGNKKNDFSELFSFLKSDFWKRTQAMVGLILNLLKIRQGIFLTIESNLPLGMGLGSSAALSVALCQAIAKVNNRKISLQKINQIAFEIEKLNHGRPSGGDNSICTFGGTIWFKKGKITPLSLPSFLENLIIVFASQRNLSTGELVQKVRNLEKKFREARIKSLAKATYEMRNALKEKDEQKIKNLINFAQDNLKELGISNPEIDYLVEKVRKIKGSAKISGGGGGTIICFHEDKNKLVNLLKKLKVRFEKIKLGAQGVRIEKDYES